MLTTTEEFLKEEEERTKENWVHFFGVKEVKLTMDEQQVGRLSLCLVSSSGSTEIDCTLRLHAVVNAAGTENQYILTNFTDVEYASYAISMVEGGTADE